MTFDDPDSMHDLELYLSAAKELVHEEWVTAAVQQRHDDSADLRRTWDHLFQALQLIKAVNINQDKD
jgi:hypothetical protein